MQNTSGRPPSLLVYLKAGFAGFRSASSLKREDYLSVLVPLIMIGVVSLIVLIGETYGGYRFNHMSSAEHWLRAKEACGSPTPNADSFCIESDVARRHLEKISRSSPEYKDASMLLARLVDRERLLEASQVEARRRADHLSSQTESQSRDQMMSNLRGESHDHFICEPSAANQPIVSFDDGHYWWADDGRCAEAVSKILRTRQESKDEDAQLSSYWPTTLRVDTDMDSFWLPNEERTCETYPDSKGTVSVVACNAEGTHREHNIPVKFWGGTQRDTVSRWKCIRDSDQFVCRAID